MRKAFFEGHHLALRGPVIPFRKDGDGPSHLQASVHMVIEGRVAVSLAHHGHVASCGPDEPPLEPSLHQSRRIGQKVKPGLYGEEHQAVSYTHLRAHETRHDLVCRLLLEK